MHIKKYPPIFGCITILVTEDTWSIWMTSLVIMLTPLPQFVDNINYSKHFQGKLAVGIQEVPV